jgi:lipoprotein-anchoring transpeptidase ErfK/SrfK
VVQPAPPSPKELPPARSRFLEINLYSQAFQYYEDDRVVLTGAISAGTPEHPTPTGRFRVLSKEKNKVSRSYTNAFNMPTPMPYALQFTGPYYIHEGWVPGYPDSHGCVRLHYEDARFLFQRMKRGDGIAITGRSAGRHRQATSEGDSAWIEESWLTPNDPRRGW